MVASGRKTVEVRKWATAIRGRVYIHAARAADERTEGWELVPDDLRPLAQLRGGLIGSGELFGCIVYRTAAAFSRDCARHLNPADWFASPRMYGFDFRNAAVVPFMPCKGAVRFFTVDDP